jgi:hypothetical protein
MPDTLERDYLACKVTLPGHNSSHILPARDGFPHLVTVLVAVMELIRRNRPFATGHWSGAGS